MTKKKIFWIAVPLVAILGVGAAGAGFKHYGGHHNPERMVERISDRLELSVVQRQKLDVIKDALVDSRQELHQEREIAMNQLITEVKNPEMDASRIMDLIDERKARIYDIAPRLLGPIVEFHNSLDDGQRAKIVNLLEAMRDWGWGHGRGNHG
jgi:Spy/CpxP family protein refolding chaperone